MRFVPTPLEGAFVIELDKREDERGFFARLFCESEFAAAGLDTRFVQINNSLSRDKGTLRGMHYQLGEAGEVKVVRCVRGTLWDAILDLRPGSATFGQSFGAELSAENRRMMYAPRGFAREVNPDRTGNASEMVLRGRMLTGAMSLQLKVVERSQREPQNRAPLRPWRRIFGALGLAG